MSDGRRLRWQPLTVLVLGAALVSLPASPAQAAHKAKQCEKVPLATNDTVNVCTFIDQQDWDGRVRAVGNAKVEKATAELSLLVKLFLDGKELDSEGPTTTDGDHLEVGTSRYKAKQGVYRVVLHYRFSTRGGSTQMGAVDTEWDTRRSGDEAGYPM